VRAGGDPPLPPTVARVLLKSRQDAAGAAQRVFAAGCPELEPVGQMLDDGVLGGLVARADALGARWRCGGCARFGRRVWGVQGGGCHRISPPYSIVRPGNQEADIACESFSKFAPRN
jgi:hypothetical protein